MSPFYDTSKMRYIPILLCILFCYCILKATCSEQTARGRVESCPGCSLNRQPEVKKFIYEDLLKYENVEFKKIQGALPELILLNESDEEIERITLSGLTREQCNKIMIDKGFQPKDDIIVLDGSFQRVKDNEL